MARCNSPQSRNIEEINRRSENEGEENENVLTLADKSKPEIKSLGENVTY